MLIDIAGGRDEYPGLIVIQWPVFCVGMLVLLFPADRLLSSGVRLRTLESFHSLENSPHGRPWWWVPVLWLDPLRALTGAWWLLRGLGLDVPGTPGLVAASIAGAVLASAAVIQCLTWRESDTLLAPIGFMGGLMLALLPLSVALPAIVLGALAMLAFHNFNLFFGVGTLVVVSLGLVLQIQPWRYALGGLAMLLPLLLTMVTRRTLELPTRLVE